MYAVNGLFGKLLNLTYEEVILDLVRTKCSLSQFCYMVYSVFSCVISTALKSVGQLTACECVWSPLQTTLFLSVNATVWSVGCDATLLTGWDVRNTSMTDRTIVFF